MSDFLRLRSNGIQYPYSISQFRVDEPHLSISDNPHSEEMESYSRLTPPVLIYRVEPTPQPSCDPRTERVEPVDPKLDGSIWRKQWRVRSATPEEIMAWDEAHKASPDWGQFRTAIRTENGYSSAFIAALQADPMVAHTLGSRLDTFQMSGEFSLFLESLILALTVLPKQDGLRIAKEFLSLSKRCSLPTPFIEALAANVILLEDV